MSKPSILQRAGKWLIVGAFLGLGLAFAQSEPNMKQIYEAAQSGHMDQAQTMMQQVLVAHPNSAKAHFVAAELAARQGKMDRAREALATAEKLSPGLSFAKPEAVQALRAQLAASLRPAPQRERVERAAMAPAAPEKSFPWGWVLLLGGGAVAIGLYLSRRNAPSAMPVAGYGNAPAPYGGLSGPQGFGGGGAMQPGYGPGYGQPQGSGMGGRIMGGLATGLAVGAGVMAAEAIGKSLMGGGEHGSRATDNQGSAGYEPFAGNSDMGGQNFGVNNADSWDDGGSVASSDDGGGGDWDS